MEKYGNGDDCMEKDDPKLYREDAEGDSSPPGPPEPVGELDHFALIGRSALGLSMGWGLGLTVNEHMSYCLCRIVMLCLGKYVCYVPVLPSAGLVGPTSPLGAATGKPDCRWGSPLWLTGLQGLLGPLRRNRATGLPEVMG